MAIKLNHIGFVVENIAEAAKLFRTLGLREITGAVPDPIQKVVACFMGTGEGGEAHIELLQPGEEDSPIANFLKKTWRRAPSHLFRGGRHQQDNG